MQYASLIPFFLLVISFVGVRLALTTSTCIALVSGTLLTEYIYSASAETWIHIFQKTGTIGVEIGLILLGAFFFLEAARKTATLESLVHLIQEISPNRVVQAVLVTFPMELLIEGSSGFGTPLLIVTPILVALGFELKLCVLLPFLTDIVGVPFGALGTPIRLGFSAGAELSRPVLSLVFWFAWIGPLLTAFLISKKTEAKEIMWILLLALLYSASAFWISASGPEFAAIAPAFFTFLVGVYSARKLFPSVTVKPIRETRGLFTYGFLLLIMWIGKQYFLDRLIPSTHIRIFNPGLVFIAVGFLVLGRFARNEIVPAIRATATRSKRTLFVFLCMTLLVQELRECGALQVLSQALPDFLLTSGSVFLGWIGTLFIGTMTMTALVFSKVVDPVQFAALGAGSAIGIQLAFQSFAAMKSLLDDRLSEKEIFFTIAPYSLGYVSIVWLACLWQHHH